MDQIINWFILIIIFVFDPLAIALVVAFNNALKVDKGEDDKKKVVQKRELYGEEPDKETQRELLVQMMKTDEEDGLYDDWDITLQDGLEDEEWDDDEDEPNEDLKESAEKYKEGKYNKHLDLDGDGIISDEERAADKDGDGKISEEEYREWYENGGWKQPYNGGAYYHNPLFDWSKKERWINDRKAIDYWLNFQGGNSNALEQYKKETKYPTDFESKTY
jgi:hypothetical protein